LPFRAIIVPAAASPPFADRFCKSPGLSPIIIRHAPARKCVGRWRRGRSRGNFDSAGGTVSWDVIRLAPVGNLKYNSCFREKRERSCARTGLHAGATSPGTCRHAPSPFQLQCRVGYDSAPVGLLLSIWFSVFHEPSSTVTSRRLSTGIDRSACCKESGRNLPSRPGCLRVLTNVWRSDG